MADSTLNARHLICALIGASLTMVALVSPLYATGLKDIRIGEYSEYTRVVFEFDKPLDKPIDQENHIAQYSNRLTVMFPETDPDLVRKIPFEQSRRIKNLQIWIGENDLSVVLFFGFTNYRYKSFRLQDPFRIAFDIYPLKEQSLNEVPSSPGANQQQPVSNSLPSLITPDHVNPMTGSRQNQHSRSDSGPSAKPDTTDQAALSDAHDLKAQDDLPPLASRSQTPISLPSSRIGTSGQGNSTSMSTALSNQKPQYATSLLQYYLIIALIILTLIILGLLTMMLLSRHKWTDENKPGQIKDLLKQQDDRIASLNAKIQEQLKRYDDV